MQDIKCPPIFMLVILIVMFISGAVVGRSIPPSSWTDVGFFVLLLVACLLGAHLGKRAGKRRVERKRRPFCPDCDYNLTGSARRGAPSAAGDSRWRSFGRRGSWAISVSNARNSFERDAEKDTWAAFLL